MGVHHRCALGVPSPEASAARPPSIRGADEATVANTRSCYRHQPSTATTRQANVPPGDDPSPGGKGGTVTTVVAGATVIVVAGVASGEVEPPRNSIHQCHTDHHEARQLPRREQSCPSTTCPPLPCWVAAVCEHRGWLLAAASRAVSPCQWDGLVNRTGSHWDIDGGLGGSTQHFGLGVLSESGVGVLPIQPPSSSATASTPTGS